MLWAKRRPLSQGVCDWNALLTRFEATTKL